jgi:hypothetical protein
MDPKNRSTRRFSVLHEGFGGDGRDPWLTNERAQYIEQGVSERLSFVHCIATTRYPLRIKYDMESSMYAGVAHKMAPLNQLESSLR